jgi:membrane-associated phospholipid phosphatase
VPGKPETPPVSTDAASVGRFAQLWASLVTFVTAVRGRLVGATLIIVAALLGIGGALWVFGEVADEVTEGETQALDGAVLLAVRQNASPTLDQAAHFFSLMGSEAVLLLLVVLLALLSWRRRWEAALMLLVTTIGAQLLNNVLKDHFQRTRPAPVLGIVPAQHWSFPSGHAMVSAAFYLLLAYLAWHVLRGWARLLAAGDLLLLVALIGWSRLYLGVHYFTDVMAGYVAGAAWTTAVIVAGHLLSHRPWRRWHSPASPVSAAPA